MSWIGAIIVAAVCGPGAEPMTMTLTSEAFAGGAPIPKQYTVEGQDLSPPLAWDNVPANCQELALVCDDPDAPSKEPWVHWVIYKIPTDVRQLPTGVPVVARPQTPAGVLQGHNSWTSGSTIGYRGPAPPPGHGVHHYHFRLYALDTKLPLAEGVDRAALAKAMTGHILAEAELIGTFQR
ncbi:MAG TPA: YbhB/YbcL family Raf kinase inhibitor-like protein [Pirellulales bacterium]|nr:YbhB/YbcL family Raf kinase inhibitor-like protein [Pirellulales bacterium]